MTRTRTRFALVGIVLVLSASAVPLLGGTATAANHTFVVEQGDRCFEVSPLRAGQNVVDFYDYRSIENSDGPTSRTYSSYMPRQLQAADVSRLFLYDGPNGVSLVVVHNSVGGDDGDGSAATFRFRGLPGGGNWVVQDDDYSDQDDGFRRNRVDWTWYGDRTDGGVFRGIDRPGTSITIDPAFDERAALYDDLDRSGSVRAWQFLTGSVSNPNAVGLRMGQPITIRTGSCNPDATPPNAALSAGDGVAGSAVALDATGAADGETGIAEYRWDVDGDGAYERTTTDPRIGYVYDDPGEYRVRVTVADGGGNTDTAAANVTVEPDDPPDAALAVEDSGVAGQPVSFRAANATDDLGIRSFLWDFDGDGDPDRRTDDPTVSYTYGRNGSYEAALTVVDRNGNRVTVNRTVAVEADDPPTASASVAGPDRPVEGQRVVLAANATDDTGVASYRWSFGDGATATGERVTHRFAENGTREVTLTVVDEGGNEATATANVTVLPPDTTPPAAAVSANLTRIEAGTAVELDAGGSSDDRGIESFGWEFGDGSATAGNGATITHLYDDPGTYEATALVTDGGDNTATATVSVEVLPRRPPNVSASVPERVVVGQRVSVSGSATDNGRVAGLRWSFGDGATATGDTATHAYSDPGTYEVTLTAVDRAGERNATTASIRVLPPDERAPNASLAVDASGRVRVGNTVRFDAGNSSDGRRVADYRWDLDGDGTVDATGNATVEHTYSDAGTYNATVTVVDGAGNADTATVQVDVKPKPRAKADGGGGGGAGGSGGGGGGGAVNLGPPPVVTEVERPGPNSALVDVRNGRADESVRMDLPETAAAGETGVRFERVTVDLARDDPHFVLEVARSAGNESTSSPADATLGSLSVGAKYLDGESVANVTYAVAVEKSRLAAANASVDDLRVYRRADGGWEEANATVSERGGAVVVRVRTDALASIAVGVDRPATATDASLSAKRVAADDPVAVTATVENPGDDAERFRANLTVDGEVVAAKNVTVPAGASETVSFERTLAPGSHEVSVAGLSVGSVTVSEETTEAPTNETTDSPETADSSGATSDSATTTSAPETTAERGDETVTLEGTGESETAGPDSPDVPVPGFGAGTAVAALLGAALLALRRRQSA